MMTDLLLLLLFLAPTIQYRVETGSVSFTLVEPVVLLVSGVLLAQQLVRRRRMVIVNDPLVFLCLGMACWAAFLGPWAADLKHGLSDIRDWAIPVLGYVVLVSTIRHGWRRWIALLLVAVVLQALLGIFQHVTNSARPFVADASAYKTGFDVSPETSQLALVSFAVGLFSHPNGYAIFLFIGLMVMLGWRAIGYWRWWKMALLIPIGLALFWAYAKASLLVMVFAVIWLWLQRWLISSRALLVMTGAFLLAGACGLWLAAQYVPAALLGTLYWRVGLWQTAFELIREQPMILFVGNGIDDFARQAYYGQPHNVYIFLLLQYGAIGLLWVMLIMSVIWRRGWRARREGLFAREPVLAALWIALLGYFAIGLVETNLLDIENRTIFFLAVACFAGLVRELRAETPSAVTREGQAYAGTAIAYSRPL
jgi:O-antigen ligase